jgi:putative flippase GtrA
MLRNLKIANKINITFFQQLAGFSIIGIIVTIASIGLLYIFIDLLKINIYFSYISVYVISIGISYLLNGKLIFKKILSFKTYVIYYGIYLSGMGLGLLIIAFVKYIFNFGDFINSVSATPFTTMWNFMLIRNIFNKYSVVQSKEKFSL